MQIIDVKTSLLRVPKDEETEDGIQDLLVIEIITDEGIVGIGEVHSSPTVAQAVIDAPLSHVASRGLKSVLIGRNPLERETLWREMFQCTSVYGRRGIVIHAISGIDIALWDIAGKAADMPVAHLLGGDANREFTAYASILMEESPELVRDSVLACLEAGFRAVKLGWGPLGESISRDAELVAAARDAGGDELELMIDIGYGVPLHYAMKLQRALEPYNLFFIEEALAPDNLSGYATLARESKTAIAAGEKSTTYYEFKQLIEIAKLDVLQPDVARAGGLTECRKIVTLAERESVLCIPHCWSSDILLAATIHLESAMAYVPYVEFCTLETPLRRSVTCERIEACNGTVKVPQGPGLGITLNQDTLAEFRVR